MKKLFFAAIIAVFSMTSMNAQDGQFGIGAHVLSDTVLGFGVDVNYLFEVADAIQVGPAIGYTTFSDKNFSLSYVPIAAAARYNVSDEFVLGLDLGYAKFLGDLGKVISGGTYYRPMAGYSFMENLSVNLYYESISFAGASDGAFGAGVMYKL